jgi:hypothetical protein
MSKKIDLEETFNNNFDCYTNFDSEGIYNDEPAMSKDKFKQVCVALVKQILELAAENAKTDCKHIADEWGMNGSLVHKVNKQSITNTIKQIQ